MNLLVFSPIPPDPGGGAKATYEISKRLVKKGHDIVIISYQKDERYEKNGIKAVSFNLKKRFWMLRGIFYILFAVIYGTIFGRCLRIDVIYAKNLTSPTIAALIVSKILRTPLIVHTSGPDIQSPELMMGHPLKVKIFKRLLKMEFKIADYIIANCRRDAECVKNIVDVDNMKIIFNGIDAKRFSPDEKTRNNLRKKLGIAPSDFVICFSGRAAKEKNISLVIDLTGKFADFRFLFIGPTRKDLEKFGEIRSNCICTGFVGNVEDYLRAADVFILPSFSEGLSNALLEAMSTGLAVISTPVSDSQYIIEDGKNGFIAKNREEFEKIINLLFENRELRSEVGSNARKFVSRTFKWENTVNELEEVILTLI